MANWGELFAVSLGRTIEDSRFNWYNLVANNCFNVIDRKVNELNTRMSSGNFLSKEEQYLLGKLHELKHEIDNELRKGAEEVQIF